MRQVAGQAQTTTEIRTQLRMQLKWTAETERRVVMMTAGPSHLRTSQMSLQWLSLQPARQ
jgi:hypothetical protein